MLVDRISKSWLGETKAPNAMTGAVSFDPTRGPKLTPFMEAGVSGLLRTKGVGYVYEEWLRDLNTYRQKMVYREMRDNDAVIGAMFFALEMILRRAEWRVEPAPKKKGEEYATFLRECIDDMSHPWEDFISECVNMFAFGFSLFEVVYKRRKGVKGKVTSNHDDGLIGWRKFAPRAQESIIHWVWDDEGGLQGAVQLAAPDYNTVTLPIEKLLLFRTTSLKNSPEGRSILRNCYRSWFFKRRIEEVEGIGIERDLCGLPVLYATAEAVLAMGGEQAARNLVTNIRIDDQAGVVLPMVFDDNGNPLVKLELLKAGGSKQTNPDQAIKRYNSDMLNTILAGFIQFGQTPNGSRSLHLNATAIFGQAIAAFMDSISSIINRVAVPRLMMMNGMDLEAAPQLKAGDIGVRDLEELSNYVTKLSSAGLTFFDRETADYLRKVAKLPKTPEEEEGGPAIQSPLFRNLPGGIPGGPQAGQPGQPGQKAPGQKTPAPGKQQLPQKSPEKAPPLKANANTSSKGNAKSRKG